MDINDILGKGFVIAGHRGLPSKYVENTITSFGQAFTYTELVELDVHLSADKKVYIIHDFNLKRLAGIDKMLEEMDSNEIEKLTVGNEHIPSLEEVLNKFKDKFFLIELKTVNEEGERLENNLPFYTVEIIKKTGMEKKVAVISFDPYSLRETHEIDSNILLGLDYDKNSEKYIGKINCKDLKSMGIDLYLPEYSGDKIKHFKEIMENGYYVMPWAVDKIEDAVKVFNAGLTGIITNKVDVMEESLKRSKEST